MGYTLYKKASGEIISWAEDLETVNQDITSEIGVLETDYLEDISYHRVVDGVLKLDENIKAELVGEDIRLERDQVLANTVDPMVSNPLRWTDLTEAKQAEWAAYRTALLDITDQAGFPHNVTWPTKPE